MSYDLDFWRYREGVTLNHQDVYERLSDGEKVDGLIDLPVKDILTRIAEAFSADWTRVDDYSWESDRGAFQLFTTDQFVRIDCYGTNGDDMNIIVDILSEFDCPLYDPQVGQRFDGAT